MQIRHYYGLLSPSTLGGRKEYLRNRKVGQHAGGRLQEVRPGHLKGWI